MNERHSWGHASAYSLMQSMWVTRNMRINREMKWGHYLILMENTMANQMVPLRSTQISLPSLSLSLSPPLSPNKHLLNSHSPWKWQSGEGVRDFLFPPSRQRGKSEFSSMRSRLSQECLSFSFSLFLFRLLFAFLSVSFSLLLSLSPSFWILSSLLLSNSFLSLSFSLLLPEGDRFSSPLLAGGNRIKKPNKVKMFRSPNHPSFFWISEIEIKFRRQWDSDITTHWSENMENNKKRKILEPTQGRESVWSCSAWGGVMGRRPRLWVGISLLFVLLAHSAHSAILTGSSWFLPFSPFFSFQSHDSPPFLSFIVTVCPSLCSYSLPSQAVAAAHDNDIIQIQAAYRMIQRSKWKNVCTSLPSHISQTIISVTPTEYSDCFYITKTNLTIEGIGGRAIIANKTCGGETHWPRLIYYETWRHIAFNMYSHIHWNPFQTKPLLSMMEISRLWNLWTCREWRHPRWMEVSLSLPPSPLPSFSPLTILHFVCADALSAGVRHEVGKLTVRDCFIHDGQEGILTNNDITQSLFIFDSEFARLGLSPHDPRGWREQRNVNRSVFVINLSTGTYGPPIGQAHGIYAGQPISPFLPFLLPSLTLSFRKDWSCWHHQFVFSRHHGGRPRSEVTRDGNQYSL